MASQSVIFRFFRSKDVTDIVNAGFPWTIDILSPPLEHRVIHSLRLIPREIRIVAYHSEEKMVVGFLRLVNHTKSFFSIEHLFTNPNYRKQGIASGLLNFAFKTAKEHGGRKVFLFVDPIEGPIKLYAKLGFKKLVNTSVATVGGFPKLNFDNRDKLFLLDSHSKENKQTLYNICANSMGDKWINFFEMTAENIFYGFAKDFQRLCLKAAFIDNSAESFALVSYIPPFSKARIEIYLGSNSNLIPMIKNLFRILHHKGIVYTKMLIFNIVSSKLNNSELSLFREFDFMNPLTIMGKMLQFS